VRVFLYLSFALLASCSSQSFVYLPLSIQRSQARSKYIHVCSGAPSVAHMACTRYTEKPNLRCWLSALRSTLFICHFRYSARRHAASTSMYAQVRHPWRTRPVCVIPKGRFTLLASCSSQSFVYLALSIQRSQACSKYFHVCSAAQSVAHMASTRYTERPNLRCWLSALRSTLFICVYLPLSIQRSQARSKYIHVCSAAPSVAHMACTRYTERPIYAAGFLLFAVLCLSATFDTTLAGTQQVHPCMLSCAILGAQGLYALYRKANLRCWLPALGSRLSALGSRLSAPSSQLPAPSSQLPAPSSELPALNFSNNNPSKT